MWNLLETAMKATTLMGVVAWTLLLSRPGPWRLAHWTGLAGGIAGVGLMVANRALEASWGGVLVDALYLGLALASVVRVLRRQTGAKPASADPTDGGGART